MLHAYLKPLPTMKRAKPRLLLTTAIVALGGFAPGLHAQQTQVPPEPNGFTWGELAILPEYCKDTQGTVYPKGSAPRTHEWVALMGEDFWHMHHYCYGMRELLRSGLAGRTPQQRQAHVERAVNEYGYIVRNASPSMILMPEVHLKIGEAQLLLGNIPAAQESFAVARKLKPDYWPAYTKWIEVLIGVKQYDAAIALAREGLTNAPDSIQLQKALTGLEQAVKKQVSRSTAAPRQIAKPQQPPQANAP